MRRIALAAAVALLALGVPAPAGAAPGTRFDVMGCDTQLGLGSTTDTTAVPKAVTARVSATVARRLTAYSSGALTALGPKGWACDAIIGADGGTNLRIFPKGKPPSDDPDAKVGESVQVDGEYTGHGPGARLVCPYFPDSAAARFFGDEGPACPALPEGRVVTPTSSPDVVRFHDAVGTVGEVVYPQVAQEPTSGEVVTYAECTLTGRRHSLCTPILADVLRRRPPVRG